MRRILTIAIAAACVVAHSINGAEQPSTPSAPLFADKVLAKGPGWAVKQSEVEDLFIAFKANRASTGQVVPESARAQAEADILDRLIATRLFLARATDEDRKKAVDVSREFVAEQKKQAVSEQSFNRQLRASGMTIEQFDKQIMEQAIVKVVIDREVKAKQTITSEQIKKFYDENPKMFEEPESVRVAHVLISTRDSVSRPLPPEQREEKRAIAKKVVERAKTEDFAALVREFSDDVESKDKGGEYLIAKGRGAVPEFEVAALTLSVGQVSDVVESRFGFHIIKALEKKPASKIELSKVEDKIRERLLQDAVQKELPGFVAQMKKEAGVEVFQTPKR